MRNAARRFGLLAVLLAPAAAAAQALVCPEAAILRDGFEPPAPAPANLTAGDAAATLDLHNCMRARVSPAAVPPLAPLSWSATVAASAQAWANTCQYFHQSGQPYGENLAAFSVGTATALQATQLWVNERSSYDYATNTCAPAAICGHYTQLVWRTTTHVGCGRAVCNTGSPFGGSGTWTFVVCRYDPPGNFNGQRPY